MPEFTQSWAFLFLIGFIIFMVGFALGFICSAILAASIRKKRIEQRLERKPGYQQVHFRVSAGASPTKIVTQNNPRTD